MDEIQKGFDDGYLSGSTASGNNKNDDDSGDNGGDKAKKTEEDITAAKEKEYDKRQKRLKFSLDMGYITEEQYQSSLMNLRNKYLEKYSEKWMSVTVANHNFELKKAEETNKANLENLKNTVDKAKSYIDDMREQREAQKEKDDLQKQINAVNEQLQYGRLDEYSRLQLEKKLAELQGQKADMDYESAAERSEEFLDRIYTMSAEAYETGSKQLAQAVQASANVLNGTVGALNIMNSMLPQAVKNQTNNLTFSMSGVAQTADQIADAVVRKISSNI